MSKGAYNRLLYQRPRCRSPWLLKTKRIQFFHADPPVIGTRSAEPKEKQRKDGTVHSQKKSLSLLQSMMTAAAASLLNFALMMPALANSSKNKHTGAEMSASSQMDQAMKKSMQDMDSMPMSGNVDEDFVRMMIPHHQAAIDAAKIQLKEGKDPEIQKIAKNDIQEQEKDIAQMKAWLKKNAKRTS